MEQEICVCCGNKVVRFCRTNYGPVCSDDCYKAVCADIVGEFKLPPEPKFVTPWSQDKRRPFYRKTCPICGADINVRTAPSDDSVCPTSRKHYTHSMSHFHHDIDIMGKSFDVKEILCGGQTLVALHNWLEEVGNKEVM